MNSGSFIGVTGGIGSGKSSVSRSLAAYTGLPMIDIDELCRELLDREMAGWNALKGCIADSFFATDGNLDRRKLRTAIFDDAGFRQQVDRLIHPLALELFRAKAAAMSGLVFVDVPLLFEAGWEKEFSRTVVVYADRFTCCCRVSSRDRIAAEEASKAIFSQMRIEDKAMLADHVIDNRYCWLLTRSQILQLAQWLRENTIIRPAGLAK